MSYDRLGKVLGRKNDRSFRTEFDALVSEPTRLRLEQETIAARTPRQAPEHTDNIGPDITPEVAALRLKVEAKKKQLNQALAALDGDLEIVHALRKSNLSGLGRPREGLYQFIEKVLGDDLEIRFKSTGASSRCANPIISSISTLLIPCPQKPEPMTISSILALRLVGELKKKDTAA